jgi:hypothetical protein
MKNGRVIFGLFVSLMIISCNQKKAISKIDTSQNQVVRDDKLDRVVDNSTFKFKSKDFQEFYNKFITDTVFQLSRVKFPLKGQYEDFDGESEWERVKWSCIKWDVRQELNKTDDSISIVQDNNRFFFGSYCRDCGFSFEMEFEKIDEEWYLTYRQENNY